MEGTHKKPIDARQRVSTLLFTILAGVAALLGLGLVLITIRLFEIRGELDLLRDTSLPRLIKLSQLSQDASAISSIAPALSQAPTRSEYDTLLARIQDKKASLNALIRELAGHFETPERIDALLRSTDLLIANLAQLTGAVDHQIAVDRQLEAIAEGFERNLGLLQSIDETADTETRAVASQAVFHVNRMILDMNRARLAKNRRAVDDSFDALNRRLLLITTDARPSPRDIKAARDIAALWNLSGQEIPSKKSTQLANAFRIKALVEENSLITNRLLSSASNEFWRAGSELEMQIRLVNETTRFTLMVIFGMVLLLLLGAFMVLRVLNQRVFRRLEQMRQSLARFAKDREHGLADTRPDEIGQISAAMAHYMSVIDEREKQLAKQTTALERLSKQLAKYLSPQVYDSIFTGKQEVKLVSSRKKLTIFFSDIVGFTETADRLESEELTQLLNHYLTEMSQIAFRHGATIDKYVGDAILIFFGDPETRGVQADALACVAMALDMQKRMEQLQDQWRKSGIERPMTARMGIHTGYCTVGNFGSEDRLDYTIIGSAVNIASRLETLAKPGEILISYETYAHVADKIACRARGEIGVKGIAYPVATYSVLDARQALEGLQNELHAHHAHLRLDLNVGLMGPEDRETAAESLKKALRLLEHGPHGMQAPQHDGALKGKRTEEATSVPSQDNPSTRK
ncbi:adenylate/guanylate cyclase domain-containing protein [Sedimentitalea sp. HM32M-2]|uniref:adenylate/guanylate cyclase domain-containing protein n=1 Tax=Sedimentitalea sp. HM32M-2 TaxID=3351566 RepID=UPI003634D209